MITQYDFRIIIIDDNIEIHKDFSKILTNIKQSSDQFSNLKQQLFSQLNESITLPVFHIDTASQGQEGVAKIAAAIAEKKPYALAFVDVRMPPGWDGIETIKHIWALDKDIQVVICTAYSDYSWEETIRELGQSDNLLILKKPFDSVAVRQLANALTRKWQLMQETHSYMLSLEEKVKERTEKLQYQATHDYLTGLLNRVAFHDIVKEVILEAQHTKEKFALLFFDLDRFKLINDSLSHAAGDELLCIVSSRLKSALREGDMIARLGGDEFVVMLRHIKNDDEINQIIPRFLSIISESFMIEERHITITSSIGVSLYPRNGKEVAELLRNADMAMYKAKKLGANRFQFYSEELNKQNLAFFEKEMELRQAILNKEFFLVYQPQIDVEHEKLMAIEALVRWEHPTKGIILPIDFIPLAEETGLIIPIGEWVLREACRQNKAWQDAGLPKLRVAVNITTYQLNQFNLVDIVKSILEETQLEPEYLELELTENSIVNNSNMINAINALRDLGIRIALDDFGTGYSSLSYLKNIHLDRLKIDRSFIKNININKGDEIIIQAIITMAKSLNLEVLAEGVETEEQIDFLMNQKCGEIQGFYFSKPLLAKRLEELLSKKGHIIEILMHNEIIPK